MGDTAELVIEANGPAMMPAPAAVQRARRPVIRQYELVERVRSYDPDADEDLLNRAYVFAMKAHGSQLRASGDPYFHHPVEVAGILTGFKLDSASIATALLHDTVEDTGATLDEIEGVFGRTVARLVDGVTKLNRLELQSAHTAQAENFRKLLLAMSEDIRVLLVKLADRLHNMRTLHFIKSPDKRRRIAAETMEIYAPLAERIGMEGLKAELEDLAFAELRPDARESVLHRLRHLRQGDVDLVDRIVTELTQVLRTAGIEADIAGREKTPYSIWRKMERKNVSFEQLSDIMAFRVHVDGVANCYAALGVIHGAYHMLPGRFKDFISTPKPNGYRSLHTTIIGPERRKIEVQIRTSDMHEIAELGVAAHWGYKQESAGHRGQAVSLDPRASRYPRACRRPRGLPREHQAGDVLRPGVLLHAQGRPDRAAARRHADRLRLCRAFPGRRPLRRRQDRRPHGPAAHPAAQRRPGRDHHQPQRHAVAGMGAVRRHGQGAGAHPALPAPAPARGSPGARPRAADQGRAPGAGDHHRQAAREGARALAPEVGRGPAGRGRATGRSRRARCWRRCIPSSSGRSRARAISSCPWRYRAARPPPTRRRPTPRLRAWHRASPSTMPAAAGQCLATRSSA